jgi:UDP-N-acetylglucosamine--N-acetylmuramyl-(pentapeptide) pyrophosphoryl-undecaprenol N-acetylglucosamine transferase
LKKIILTGGGSAGHVTPNIALFPKLKSLGFEIQYIGTKDGIERNIIGKEDIKYHCISSGKLRRYFDVKNFTDPFKVIKGIFECISIMKSEKPDIVFSKGGFVSVPVVIGAHFCHVPVIAHESDLTPGLANRISERYCTKICVTFPETVDKIKDGKAILTGTPIRNKILEGSKLLGLKFCGFDGAKPVLLIIGGSLGSRFINDCVRDSLSKLLEKYDIVHICGKGNLDKKLENIKGYRQFEYLNEELPHVMQAADIIISRAGANLIFEILAIKKPNLLIPLSRKSSRGDQILNAESFKKSGFSKVIYEEEITSEVLINSLNELYQNRMQYISAMNSSKLQNGVDGIVSVINKFAK